MNIKKGVQNNTGSDVNNDINMTNGRWWSKII